MNSEVITRRLDQNTEIMKYIKLQANRYIINIAPSPPCVPKLNGPRSICIYIYIQEKYSRDVMEYQDVC